MGTYTYRHIHTHTYTLLLYERTNCLNITVHTNITIHLYTNKQYADMHKHIYILAHT